MTAARRDPLIGTVIGAQYRVDAKIGEGGMGAVYRATQLAVRREVAVKTLNPLVPEAERLSLVERFRREALATSRLNHPNTVRVIDFGETTDGLLYMVLELLNGAPLSQVIAQDAPLPPERVAVIGKQMAKSLAEAHELGIVHRDLKPDNVFICRYHGESDFTKVMDFGIARLLSGNEGVANVTRTGMMIGTPRYISPEQAMARQVTPAADLYSLGVILYEMLTGKPPFLAENQLALALAHINEPPPPMALPAMPPQQAEAWRGLVGALLEKAPRNRPQAAAEVANWLSQLELDALRAALPRAAWAATATTPGREPPSTYEGPSPKSTVTVAGAGAGRGGLWLAVAALAFMVLGGAVAFFLLTSGTGGAGGAAPATQTPADQVARPGATTATPPRPAGAATEPAPAAADARTTAEREVSADESAPARTGPTRLLLASTPDGAAVTRGETPLCTTPCDTNLDGARGTPWALTITLDGYRSEAVTVELAPGETVMRDVTLEAAPAPTPRPRPTPRVRPTPRDDGPGLPRLRLDGGD